MSMVYVDLKERHQYREQLARLADLAELDSLPTQIIPATKFNSVNDLMNRYTTAYVWLIDSLGLSDNVLGVVVRHDFRPTGVAGFRYGISQMDVFTSCGCDQEGSFALQTLEVDHITMSAHVVASYDAITLAGYQTLNRYSLKN